MNKTKTTSCKRSGFFMIQNDTQRLLMNKNYYWVYNVFNETEFKDSKNDTFKDLALITKNNFENMNEFKKSFNQFKALGTYKNKFDKKHQKN